MCTNPGAGMEERAEGDEVKREEDETMNVRITFQLLMAEPEFRPARLPIGSSSLQASACD